MAAATDAEGDVSMHSTATIKPKSNKNSSQTNPPPPSSNKSYDIFSCTIRDPPFAYAQLQVDTDNPEAPELDDLQARSYCASALQQFLGVTGAAVTVDVLKVEGREFWVRVPQPDLGRFSAAVTAWPGIVTIQSGEATTTILRIKACGDWLGSLLGRSEQHKLWNP